MLLIFTRLKTKNTKFEYEYEDKSYEQIMLDISKILLLIFFILSFKIHFIKKNKNFLNMKSKDRSYSLYNYFKYPQISIIIPDVDEWEKNPNILKLIENLRNQTLNNIEIILTSTKTAFKEYKKIKNLCLSDKRIKLEKSKNKNSIRNIFSLINLLKGKFVLIINKYFNFKSFDFEKYYNFTKGKINHIFEFKIKKETLYLIKSKILRDINDKNINFNNFSDLLQYITSLPEPQLNYISVALSTNNYYISLAYVCMTSILYSKYAYSYVSFYVILSKDFFQKNIEFLKSLYDQYDYFNITILKIDNRYNKAYISSYITKEAYFRFSLGELIPHLDKIIYLDNDVIVLKDLTNIYDMNFNNKMILGQPIYFEKNSGLYAINSGIMLLNLKKMRETNMEKKILNITIKKREKYRFHDQTIINKYFKGYLGIFPPENHARPYNESEIIKFNNKTSNIYNIDYYLFSWKYPTMRHYLGRKYIIKF
jgi:lipopolysaccharide biosynthesis glycosyltransferase